VLCRLPLSDDPNFINKDQHFADAGIYRISENLALVQTVDYFTPVTDDPYLFGQIAVANSLSDVYAVGGKPLTAMNIICFPCKKLPLEYMEAILQGGLSKMLEANVTLVGGHSVDDLEPKYGLSVTGIVDPGKMITGSGAKPGDSLVLTKPLGTGIIVTALKGDFLSPQEAADTFQGMATLNAAASRAMVRAGVSACTDVSGFGLVGHLQEMLISSKVGARINLKALPLYRGVAEMSAQGLIPGGDYRNLEYYKKDLIFEAEESELQESMILLADAQTSGGLLMAVSPTRLEQLLAELYKEGSQGYVIGEITAGPEGKIAIY